MIVQTLLVTALFVFYSFIQVVSAGIPQGFLNINETYSAVRTLYVKDGDSFVVKMGEYRFEVRLWGIDSPEYDQPHSDESKMILKRFILNKKLDIRVKDIDKYGRYIVVASCGNSILNRELIAAGAAWVHRYYCRESICDEWLDLEKRALRNKIGLWKYDDPIEPWIWKQSR